MSNPWTLRHVLHLVLASTITCSPLASDPNLQQRQASVSVVTGIGWKDANGNVPVRREIRDLQTNYPDQWSLYLQGLEALHWSDQNDPLSLYGIASIHGRPYRTWGDAPGLAHKIGNSGYCPHGNMLFLGWHRPYLALFEQALYNHIQYIASTAPEDQQARYKSAADSFRIPYWDWARSDGSVPDFVVQQSIWITRTNGVQDYIYNPLYSYKFHSVVPGDFEGKWSHINETYRWPTSAAWDASSDESHMVSSYQSEQYALVDKVNEAFRQTTLNAFSVSLEQAHGWIHGVIGGNYDRDTSLWGHMWPLEYSSYEPMFMLHHANVDRLFAMYQAANPNTYMDPANVGNAGNVYLENYQMVDANTELLPFRKSSGGFWTTNDIRSTEIFGYAYPETQKIGQPSIADLLSSVKATIARLYSSSARNVLMASPATADGRMLLSDNRTFTDWTITMQAPSLALPSTFIIRFLFTGDFSSDPVVDVGRWMKLMPSDHNAASHDSTQMASASTNDLTVKGTVSLTTRLLEQVDGGKLASLDAMDVVPFLKQSLTWKGISGDGTQLSQTSLNAVTFDIISTKAHIPDDIDAPIEYSSDVVSHPDVVVGKTGATKV